MRATYFYDFIGDTIIIMLLSLTIYVAFAFLSIQLCGTKMISNSSIICNLKKLCSSNLDCLVNQTCVINGSCGICIENMIAISCDDNNLCSHANNCSSPSVCIFHPGQKCGVCEIDKLLNSTIASNTSLYCKTQNLCLDAFDCANGFECVNYSNAYCGKCISERIKRQSCNAKGECDTYFDCKEGSVCFRLNVNQQCGQCLIEDVPGQQSIADILQSQIPKKKKSGISSDNSCPVIKYCDSELDCSPNQNCNKNFGLPCKICMDTNIGSIKEDYPIMDVNNEFCECSLTTVCSEGWTCNFISTDESCGKCIQNCECINDSDCKRSGQTCTITQGRKCGVCSQLCECYKDTDCPPSFKCEINPLDKSTCGICWALVEGSSTLANCSGFYTCRDSKDCKSDSYCEIINGNNCGMCELLTHRQPKNSPESQTNTKCFTDCFEDVDCPQNFLCRSLDENPCHNVCVRKRVKNELT